ncbi:IS30 family transposase [Marinovum sp.]|uniref:IS30 family transposase n=1 Tax=Marinovum sp. TaxID=2024839 RepID=UPI003A5C8837
MAHTELELRERHQIEDMQYAKVPVSKIATEFGRHRSTIYREIKRISCVDQELPDLDGYYGMNAQRFASARRARRRKLIRLPKLRAAVIDRLKEGWSPEQIAGRLGFESHAVRVCHETIYAHVYSREGQSDALARYLPSRRRKRKPRYARRPRSLVFPPDRSIHERPDHVEDPREIRRMGRGSDDFREGPGQDERGPPGRTQDPFCRAVPPQRPQLDAFHEPADGRDGLPAPTGASLDHL